MPYDTMHYAFKLLDSYLLGQWRDSDGSNDKLGADDETWLAEGIVRLAVSAEHCREQGMSS